MKKEKENVYKKIYDAYCKWIKDTEYKNSFLFFDNDEVYVLKRGKK